MTKWDNDVPISNHDPSLVTWKKNTSPIMSEKTKTMRNKAFCGIWLIYCTQKANKATRKKGNITFKSNRLPIRKGLKVVTKVWILLGSKLFKLEIFPVPKNDTMVKVKKVKALLRSSLVKTFLCLGET